MTANQLAYMANKERERNNRAVEFETNRHNVETENLGHSTLAETTRHNYATEANQLFSFQEQARHNKATEDETSRHNKAYESETNRANRARESENYRSNRANEAIGWATISEARRHNYAGEANQLYGINVTDWYNRQQANIRKSELREKRVSNYRTIAEQRRHNEAQERETATHNDVNEMVDKWNALTGTWESVLHSSKEARSWLTWYRATK
uniref:ORF1 n=1 Tax=Macaque picobirnavirus 15 TaxID=2078795 RepID=A0A2L1FE80_9VIRU|nr:ORF1 [Macaque picobirnavirus 15]